MKTRTVIRHREVEHVEGGVPRMITEPYEVEVPVAPHDWDRIVFNGAMVAAISFTAVSVGWSAVSGGALLATTAPGWIAYPAALAYDAAWITCMALEWLSRYDADRAQLPRRLGYLALLIAMGVICTHGVLTAGVAEGIAGSVISLIAKGLWALVLRHTSQALPYRTREWLKVSRAEIGAQLAIASQQRDLLRTQAQHAALVAATGDTVAPVATPATPVALPAVAPAATVPHRPAPVVVPVGARLLKIVPATAPVAPRTTPATPLRPAMQPPATDAVSHIDRNVRDATRPVADDRDTPRLLTVADIATLCGVTQGTVRSWVNRGHLAPTSRDSNGRNTFHPDAVAALPGRNATPSQDPRPMEGGYA